MRQTKVQLWNCGLAKLEGLEALRNILVVATTAPSAAEWVVTSTCALTLEEGL